MEWGVCNNPAIFLDVSHYQGLGIDYVKCKELGVRGVIAKRFHGKAPVSAYDEQMAEASAAGIPILGDYGWFVPTLIPPDLQVDAWTAPPKEHLPFTIDWEDESTKLRGKSLIQLGERAIELVSDKHGRRPILYTGEGYWQTFCLNLDSEIFASCPLWLAAYPRKSNTGTRYQEAVAEVCGGHAPAIPFPWRSRDLQPIGWQFSGDPYALTLPPSKNGARPVVDVSAFDLDRVHELFDAPPDTLPEGEAAKRKSSQRIEAQHSAFISGATPITSQPAEYTPRDTSE